MDFCSIKTVLTHIRIHKRKVAFFLLMVFCNLLVYSCTYYKNPTIRNAPLKLSQVNEILNEDHGYLIISNDQYWQAYNLNLTQDSLSMMLVKATESFENSIGEIENRTENRIKGDEKWYGKLVKIYLNSERSLEPGQSQISLSSIQRIDIYSPDVGRNIGSFMGGAAIAFVVLMAIIILTKSSCPFIYAHDGTGYLLSGEAFGGAIHSGLERSDFIAMPYAKSVDGEYRFKIRNELKERQFINKVRLIEASVPEGNSILIDKYGELHSISKPLPPYSAISDSGFDYTDVLRKIDSVNYNFNDGGNVNSLIMTFAKPSGTTNGKLVLKTKGTLWFDYVFGEFTKLFGDYYPAFIQKESKKPIEEAYDWSIAQNIPLEISIKIENEWVHVDYIDPIGPLADSRDIVIPIDLTKITSDDIQIKISTGYYFWQIDYAGIDYSDDKVLQIVSSPPSISTTQDQVDTNYLLALDDSLYVQQLNVGDELDLIFSSILANEPGQNMVFLEVKGYYEHIRNFENSPDFIELRKFKQPNTLAKFSRENYNYYEAPFIAGVESNNDIQMDDESPK